jgi:hypothetical protein
MFYAPLILCHFGLMPFGWLCFVMFIRTQSVIIYENVILDVLLFDLRLCFREHSWGVKQGLGI